MKIKKIEKLQDLLDNDFAWRKKELIDFQMIIHSTKNKTICRMGIALLCAHFEGFVKKAANYYIVFVSSQNLKLSELQINFAALYCQGNLNLINGTDKISVYSNVLHSFLESYENLNFNIRYSWDKPIIKTGGNPSSLVFKEILNSIGLDFSIYETKQKYIDTDLLSNRHGIVHGEKVFIEENEFDETLKNIIEIMEVFKNQILDAAISQRYLKLGSK